ncbi:alpha/beta hydrolase [Spirochaetota bacterium]
MIKAALLFLISLDLIIAADINIYKIFSKSMRKKISFIVITPKTYHMSDKKYNVVYLLHGYGWDNKIFIFPFPVKRLADKYDVIVACPDGAKSWYMDSPVKKKSTYETHITKEVVTFTDRKLRTVRHKKGRAIVGFSMGGFGALYVAFRNKNIFGAAGSMGGGVDVMPFPKKWGLKKVLGNIKKYRQYWEDHRIISVMHELKNNDLAIMIDCGLKDPFLDGNRELHNELLSKNIEHDYREGKGGHTIIYWLKSIEIQMEFFNDFFHADS